MSTSESKTSHSPSPTTPPTDPAIDPLQIPSLPTPPGLVPADAAFPVSVTTSSLAELSPAAELATIDDYDDGFSDSVPFQALALRINRSKGIIVLEGDAEERESVFLVPRGSQLSKSYYGMPYDPKTPHEASCASPDGKTGYGWIDADAQDDVHTRSCLNCQRRGFGAGTCDDLQTLLAYDVEKSTPVLVTFKNAEINQRRGVFTLAVTEPAAARGDRVGVRGKRGGRAVREGGACRRARERGLGADRRRRCREPAAAGAGARARPCGGLDAAADPLHGQRRDDRRRRLRAPRSDGGAASAPRYPPDGEAPPAREEDEVTQQPGAAHAPWQRLNFLPLPHGQGSFRPTFAVTRVAVAVAAPTPAPSGSPGPLSLIRWGARSWAIASAAA